MWTTQALHWERRRLACREHRKVRPLAKHSTSDALFALRAQRAGEPPALPVKSLIFRIEGSQRVLVSANNAGSFWNEEFCVAVFVHRSFAMQAVFISGTDKRGKQRISAQGLRLVFRVKLTSQEPWMVVSR